MKDVLLRKYARRNGHDYQHFAPLKCWLCQGIGEFGYTGECKRCLGTGHYRPERWILLQRWDLCGWIFHQPIGAPSHRPTPGISINVIEGLIQHQGNTQNAEQAYRWLCMFTGRYEQAQPSSWQTKQWHATTPDDDLPF